MIDCISKEEKFTLFGCAVSAGLVADAAGRPPRSHQQATQAAASAGWSQLAERAD